MSTTPAAAPAEIRGRTEPRIFTPPLRELTPETSYGYAVIRFAAGVLGLELDPWQQFAVIHAGELLADGVTPRFRYVLVLVARQQGKTLLCQVLTLYWLWVEARRLVLGTSTSRDYAKAAWLDTIDRAMSVEQLAQDVPRGGVRTANGNEVFTVAPAGQRKREYVIAASNRRAGRSRTVHRLILDELREHQTWDAWNAATKAMNAVPDAQCWAITNQGDDASVVLDGLRDPAVAAIDAPADPDDDVCILEWSSPAGADPTDPEALAYANPSLGLGRTSLRSLLGDARRAKAAGGDELAGFKTEVMCQRVPRLNPAISAERWAECADQQPVNLAGHRRRVALCVDVSLDEQHATLVAAAVLGEGDAALVHVEVLAQWEGEDATIDLRRELPGWVKRVRPRALGWFPHGPAAAVAARLADRNRRGWPPRGVEVSAMEAEHTAVCMGLAEQVKAREIRYPAGDALLTTHVESVQKGRRGDGWVFIRRGSGPIDAAYALAGAVHLARTIPPPPAPLVTA